MDRVRRAQYSDRELIFKWRNLDFNRVKMINSKRISWKEHCEWWDKKQEEKDFSMLILTSHDTDLSVINFFSKKNCKFWGFYLTEFGAQTSWPALIKTESTALKFFKDSNTADELFCETLLSNSAVWQLHERFGFTDRGIQKDTNTLLQSIKCNEIFI